MNINDCWGGWQESAVLDDEEDARQIKLDEIAARIEREKAKALAADVSAFERDLT